MKLKRKHSATLTAQEIRHLAQYCGMVLQEPTAREAEDERETEIIIAPWPEKGVQGDDGMLPPHNHIAYLAEYPEEGCVPLGSPNKDSALPRLRTHLAQLAPHVVARVTGRLLKDAADEIERLIHENSVLCDFINREMKMTASDPRIAELQKRMDAKPNAEIRDAAPRTASAETKTGDGAVTQPGVNPHNELQDPRVTANG